MPRGLLLVAFALGIVAQAQASPAPPPTALSVFVEDAPERGATDTLILHSLLTGVDTRLRTTGRQYSLIADQVVFLDETTGRVQSVNTDGSIQEHPIIQPAAGARRIDWISSASAGLVAWTVTEGTPDALTTATYVASPEGAGMRLALRDGPREGIRAYPVAFSEDGATLFMDYQPDTIADLTPVQQYAALFALDLTSGTASSLPGEPGCYCGGAIGEGRFARLALAQAGFEVRVTDLATGHTRVIESLGLAEYTQAGDMLIAPGGGQALYTLLRLIPGSAPGEGTQTLLVLADLNAGTQRVLNAGNPETRVLRPLMWSSDGNGVLLGSSAEAGTWRLDVSSGAISRVANARFIGSTVTTAGVR